MSLTEREIADNKRRFTDLLRENVKRDGIEKLTDYLENRSDFFIAPASTRFHGSYDGGLAQHSLNVYDCLKDYLSRQRAKERYGMDYSEETVAITALLHDICKADVYQRGTRNVKNEQGVWEQVPTYFFEDNLPYGHGEKSVYMITGFMKLTREEAFAIRYHMGFSGVEEKNNVSKAFEMFPLAFALSTADMEASYFID